MPFDESFWKSPQQAPITTDLEKVKGFITALPIEWTKGENNNFGYHTSLVARNDVPGTLRPDMKEQATLQAKRSSGIAESSEEEAAG